MIQVSCVVCHHKGEKLVTDTLESIHKSVDIDYEIIVVTSCDNKSFH